MKWDEDDEPEEDEPVIDTTGETEDIPIAG